jgi:hypothetical protein
MRDGVEGTFSAEPPTGNPNNHTSHMFENLLCSGTAGRGYGPKNMDTISFLQQQVAGEPYTPYQGIAPPLQAKEEWPPT